MWIARRGSGRPTHVADLVEAFAVPRLAAYGIVPADLPEIVAKSQQASSMKVNPIALTAGELARVLAQAL